MLGFVLDETPRGRGERGLEWMVDFSRALKRGKRQTLIVVLSPDQFIVYICGEFLELLAGESCEFLSCS